MDTMVATVPGAARQRMGRELLLLVALALGASGCSVFSRSVDVYYKAYWVIAHWSDAKLFPPKSDLCTAPFCTRTDTAKKYVGGRPGYTSQVKYHYCPAHSPTFFATGSRIDGLLYTFYFGLAIFLSYGVAFVGLGLLLFPLVSVGGLVGALFARKKAPDTPSALSWNTLLGWDLAIAVIAATPICALSWLMYAWW
jgi:hypothetical protein